MLEGFRLADAGEGVFPRVPQQSLDAFQNAAVRFLPVVEIRRAVLGEFDLEGQSMGLSTSFPALACSADSCRRLAFSSLLRRWAVSFTASHSFSGTITKFFPSARVTVTGSPESITPSTISPTLRRNWV